MKEPILIIAFILVIFFTIGFTPDFINTVNAINYTAWTGTGSAIAIVFAKNSPYIIASFVILLMGYFIYLEIKEYDEA